MHAKPTALAGLLLLLHCQSTLYAQQECNAAESFELDAAAASAWDNFGQAVALSGEIAVIGAPYDDDVAMDAGAACVFRFVDGAWTTPVELTAADGGALDHFGWAVAVNGDMVVVGSPDDDERGLNSGAAYVFRFANGAWREEAKLLATEGAAGDLFGSSVAAGGDAVVVGAPRADGSGSDSGAAYVFRFNGSSWVQEARLAASDGEAGDNFGHALALSGDAVLVAAPHDDDAGASSGSVYVFRFAAGGWAEEAKLTAFDGAISDQFGESVALSGDLAIVGSPNDDDLGPNSGAAYLFRLDGDDWVLEDKLTAFDGEFGDRFGQAVAADGDKIVVAAPGDDDGTSNAGSVYACFFDGVVWAPRGKLNASAVARQSFGVGVALRGDTCLVGAPQNGDAGPWAGSAYVYHAVSDCNDNGVMDLCDLASGASDDLNANFVPDECDPDCNGNAVPDDLDIARGDSNDCNGNGVPDECDLADGLADDCNGNGVPDECEIAAGLSSDCDSNGVPDECDPDGDGDGVIDQCDQCPDTEPGDEVDEFGCGVGGDDGDDDKRVQLCHVPPGNPDRRHTIRVSAAAVDAHLAHGDFLGSCEDEDGSEDDGSGGGKPKGGRPSLDEPEQEDLVDSPEKAPDDEGDHASRFTEDEPELFLGPMTCGAGGLGLLPLMFAGLAAMRVRTFGQRRRR